MNQLLLIFVSTVGFTQSLSFIDEAIPIYAPLVQMENIVECRGDLCEQINKIIVDPNLSSKRTLFRKDIERILAIDKITTLIKWNGEDSVVIDPQKVELSKSWVHEQISERIMAVLPENIRLKNFKISSLKKHKVWPADWKVFIPLFDQARFEDVTWISQKFLKARYIAMDINTQHEDITLRIPFHADFEIKIPVARKFLAKNHKIRTQDIELNWVSLNRSFHQNLTSEGDLIGFIVKKEINIGQPFRGHLLGKRVVVRRGDTIQTVLTKGQLRVKVEAKAMQSGGVGDKIRVLYPKTRKTLFGKILKDESIEVYL